MFFLAAIFKLPAKINSDIMGMILNKDIKKGVVSFEGKSKRSPG